MTEALIAIASPEQQQHPDVLVLGDELRAVYGQRFAEMELPSTYQMPQDGRYGDRVFTVGASDSPLSPEEVLLCRLVGKLMMIHGG